MAEIPHEAVQLRASLDMTADALVRSSIEGLLAAEIALTAALVRLPALRALQGADKAVAREELLAAQTALRRCRRLGASLTEVVRLSLDAHGQRAGYDPVGGVARELTGRGFNGSA